MKRRSRQHPLKRFLLFLLFLALAVGAWLGYRIYQKVFLPYQGYAKNAVVRIESGMPVSAIGRKLQEHGVIASAEYFNRYYRMFFAGRKLEGRRVSFRRSPDHAPGHCKT